MAETPEMTPLMAQAFLAQVFYVIEHLTKIECLFLRRYAPAGSKLFNLHTAFGLLLEAHMHAIGHEMTPGISKQLYLMREGGDYEWLIDFSNQLDHPALQQAEDACVSLLWPGEPDAIPAPNGLTNRSSVPRRLLILRSYFNGLPNGDYGPGVVERTGSGGTLRVPAGLDGSLSG